MGENTDSIIIRSVQGHVDRIVHELRLDAGDNKIEVCRMGSREYGCALGSSDLDLYLQVPDDWACHAKAIRVSLAATLEESRQAKDGADAPEDQPRNFTLKWTSTTYNLDVSLLVAVEHVITNAVSATKCLAWHFKRNKPLRDIVKETLRRLREEGVLNSHGRKASVKQSLKTTPAALLCVAVWKDRKFEKDLITAQPVERLLRALGAFNATVSCVKYNDNDCERDVRPVSGYVDCPLCILRGERNSASRLTHPQWAKFQYVCHRLSGLANFSLFPSFNKGEKLTFPPLPNSPLHLPLHLPGTWDDVKKDEDFAVLSVWPRSGNGTLLVASGSSNDAEFKIKGYKYIVAVTWCKGYTFNPTWFPQILLSLADWLCKPKGEKLDVLGLSRGVQAVMSCYDQKNIYWFRNARTEQPYLRFFVW